MAIFGQKWPFFEKFFSIKKRLEMANKERKCLKISFSFYLEFFRAFFRRKIWCQKLAKSKANPLPKYRFLAKNSIF